MGLKGLIDSLEYWRSSAQYWRKLGLMREWSLCMGSCKSRIKWIREEFPIEQ